MKIIAYYENETREVEVSNFDVVFKFEISSKLLNNRIMELRNTNVDRVGLKLEPLLPTLTDISTLRKIEIFSDSGTMIKSSDKIASVFYRLATQTLLKDVAPGELAPPMMESFVINIEVIEPATV